MAINVKPCLRLSTLAGKRTVMSKDVSELTREERLAAKLRENLRRRKTQARGLDRNQEQSNEAPLSKMPPKS